MNNEKDSNKLVTIKEKIVKIRISIIFSKIKVIGLIVAAIPKTNKILKTFEPITFPRAISTSPFLAATIEVTSSGKEVPRATMVRPTKFCDIPKDKAILEALSTTKSPPNLIAIAPPTI